MCPPSQSFDCSICGLTCRSSGGLYQHRYAKHPRITPPEDFTKRDRLFHRKLTARPCDENGIFLAPESSPNTQECEDTEDVNPWAPFEDRLAFDWAWYQYVQLQSSKREIGRGLDLWLATAIKCGFTAPSTMDNGAAIPPWRSAEELYATIDSIQAGDAPWKTYIFKYTGPKPESPPPWMEEEYELNVRDILVLLEDQLATSDFRDCFDYQPYREFDFNGDRVWSNLMSGSWAYEEATQIAKDRKMRGAMLVPVLAGSDKTTVSVASGSQEFHPVYASLGNISNAARRGHGNGVLPFAFLPIPKASKPQRKKPIFQQFCRQLYHKCLEVAFSPLKPYMTATKIVKCPDGHFRRAVFSLGPYIADYPEQVWLAGIVSNWCAKCDAQPNSLDNPGSHRRLHEKTDYLIKTFNPGILWDEFGIRNDVVPFTHSFPRADIHRLLAPDLLHQLIKGTFKDHLVTWVGEYLHVKYGEKRALEIIEDIDHRISAVPPFPGLRRFPDGRDFKQWTGDDSKALMKVYVAAIAGYVPSRMVKCISTFIDACYIARRNMISAPVLERLRSCVAQFHELRDIFITSGVRATISLPRQHALVHYLYSIPYFGSPNGTCSSITESKHIKAVKEPWRRSNRYKALSQMLRTIMRMEKMASLHRVLEQEGLMTGTTASHYMASSTIRVTYSDSSHSEASSDSDLSSISINNAKGMPDGDTSANDADCGPDDGSQPPPKMESVFDIKLSARPSYQYPRRLQELSNYTNLPALPIALRQFLFECDNPDAEETPTLDQCPDFDGRIYVHHSAVSTYFSPSDVCGAGGMHRELIRSNPSFFGHPRRDTVFVVLDDNLPGMEGMVIARVLLFFSFQYRRRDYSCALVNWFVRDDDTPDEDTGMWTVHLEEDESEPVYQVISVDSIARGAHLLPVFGSSRVPDNFSHHDALDSYNSFFVNHFVDHHAHEFLIV